VVAASARRTRVLSDRKCLPGTGLAAYWARSSASVIRASASKLVPLSWRSAPSRVPVARGDSLGA
jgi:hypothetical protein